MSFKDAAIEAIENADVWMNGSVVVLEDDDSYTAIPSAYINDASYTGSREIVLDLTNGLMNSTGLSLPDEYGTTSEEIFNLIC